MSKIAITIGLLLIAVTAVVIAANGGFKSFTVFIPSIIGILLSICGVIGFNDSLRKHAMHAAATIALIGGGGCLFMGLRQLGKLGAPEPPTAVQLGSVWSTAILCLVFLVLCINSFIQARKARTASES